MKNKVNKPFKNKNFFEALKNSINGIVLAFISESNIKIDVVATIVVIIAAIISILLKYFLPFISSGFSVIISAVIAAVICAALFPVSEEEGS